MENDKIKRVVRFWTEEEDNLLKEMYPNLDMSYPEMTERLPGRTRVAIKSRAKVLGVQRLAWTKDELDFLKRVYEDLNYTTVEIADALNKTTAAVTSKAMRLKLTRNDYIKDNKKFCHSCKTEKDISEFHKNKSKKIGLGSYCKDCKSKKNREAARLKKVK